MSIHDHTHHEPPTPIEPGSIDWIRELGADDNTRSALSRSVAGLCAQRFTSKSTPAGQVSGIDLYRIKQLSGSLGLTSSDELQKRVVDALLEAGRRIARLRPEDIQLEAEHQAYLIEAEADREEEIKVAKDELYDIYLGAQRQRRQLIQRSSGSAQPGEAIPRAIDAASARLERDEQWAFDTLRTLRDL